MLFVLFVVLGGFWLGVGLLCGLFVVFVCWFGVGCFVFGISFGCGFVVWMVLDFVLGFCWFCVCGLYGSCLNGCVVLRGCCVGLLLRLLWCLLFWVIFVRCGFVL